MEWRDTARKAGFGRAKYYAWHAPMGWWRRMQADGGPIEQWRTSRGRDEMCAAAAHLATSREPPPGPFELNFLTGTNFWYQTAFCLHSLQLQSGRTFRAVFHDDGTLKNGERNHLRALFPAAEIRPHSAERVAELLPPGRYPAIHAELDRVHPNFRKLTGVHLGQRGWRLTLDSDMLFFRRPDFLLDWISTPDRPLHMVDVETSYGYSLDLMGKLAGAPVAPRINVGAFGIDSSTIDWDRVEQWCRQLVAAEGSSYYIEQAISAMMCAGRPVSELPTADYVVFPSESESRAPTAVLHHYVAGSKRWYFRETWRRS